MKSKSVDINQRIPLEILAVALHGHLTGNYDENYIFKLVFAFFSYLALAFKTS